MSDHPPSGDSLHNPSVRSEPTDLSFRGVALFAGGLFAMLVVLGAGIWGLLHLFVAREAEQKKVEHSWPTENERIVQTVAGNDEHSRLPTLPRLEGMDLERADQPGDIKEQVQKENDRLNSYGWVDRERNVVHIPIEEAMEKTRAKLKKRSGTDVDEFLQAPSRSSSGRMPRGGTK
jgi:hypothetical protein